MDMKYSALYFAKNYFNQKGMKFLMKD